jgi:hypothetical protein
MEVKDNETLKYLKGRDAIIIAWLKEAGFNIAFFYIWFTFYSEKGISILITLYLLARFGFYTIANYQKKDITDLTFWRFFNGLWRCALYLGCLYELINRGIYFMMGFALANGFVALVVWIAREDVKERRGEPNAIVRPLLEACGILSIILIPLWLLSNGPDSVPGRFIVIPFGYLMIGICPGTIVYLVSRKRLSKRISIAIGLVAGVLSFSLFFSISNHPRVSFPVQTTEYRRSYSIDYYSEVERATCETLRNHLMNNPATYVDPDNKQILACASRWMKSGLTMHDLRGQNL